MAAALDVAEVLDTSNASAWATRVVQAERNTEAANFDVLSLMSSRGFAVPSNKVRTTVI